MNFKSTMILCAICVFKNLFIEMKILKRESFTIVVFIFVIMPQTMCKKIFNGNLNERY